MILSIFSILLWGLIGFRFGVRGRFQCSAILCTFLGVGAGMGIGLSGAARMIYEDFSAYTGMELQRIRVVEGSLQQDGSRRGKVSLLPLTVHTVRDSSGNSHSARIRLTVVTNSSSTFLAGDVVRVRGSISTEQDLMFLAEWGESVSLRKRPLLPSFRNWVIGNRVYPEGRESEALLDALFFGIKDGLSKDLRGRFQASGTSHILALSGMHVGIIVVLLSFSLKPLLSGWCLPCTLSGILILYGFIVGPFPSIVRAILMYLIHTAAFLLKRRLHSMDLLSLTLLFSSLLFPEGILSVSNILSYAAVAGILVLSPYLQVFFRKYIFEPFLSALSISLGAQLSTIPLTMMFFSQLSPLGWLASICLTPWISLFLWVGIPFYFFQNIPALGDSLRWILEFLYTLILTVVDCFSRVPVVRFT